MTPSRARLGLIFFCGLLGAATAMAGTAPPMLRVNFTDSSTPQTFCLDTVPASIQVVDSETFIEVLALPECPPQGIVAINSFLADDDPTDGTGAGTNIQFDVVEDISNCVIGGQPNTCLFLTWDTTVGFDVDTPTCSISQKDSPIMSPSFISNPGTNSPSEPPLTPTYVEDLAAPGLAWPIANPGALTAGTSIVYRLNCTGGQTSTVTVNFVDGTTSTVTINSFNISQTSAAQGTTINFSYNLTLTNNPSAPSCTLSAPGVINTVTLNNVVDGSANGSATIRSDATTGTQVFTFSCRPDAGSAATDTATDSVSITTGSTGGSCPSNLPGTNITRDSTQTEFAQLYAENSDANTTNDIDWPGQWGVSGNPAQRLSVATNQYKALRFNTGTAESTELRGRFEWGKSGVGGVPRAATYTLSTTCGELVPSNPACRRFSAANRIPWHFSDSPNPEPGSCLLQRNTTYYINIIYDDATDGLGNTTCSSGSCNHLINAGGGPPAFPN